MDIDINEYKRTLKNEGYKLTEQRRAILKAIIENHDAHLSCDELFKLVSKKHPDIGIATIYRTLQLFEELKIVHKVNFDDGFSRYELNSPVEEHHHHHLICLECSKVLEVQADLLESLEEKIENEGAFTIVNHNVQFYGYCSDCRKRKNRK